LAEQTSLVARQQAELAALRDELDELGRHNEARLAETDRAAAEALAAAEELQERGANFEARQAAAWRELDRQRTLFATLESIRFESLDELHVRAAESQPGGDDLERLRSELEADRASIDEACLAVQQQAEVLEAQRRAIEQQREAWEQTQSQAAQKAEALAASLDDLESQWAELATERQAWEAKQSEAEGSLADRIAQLDAREHSLATQEASTETVVNVPPVEDRDWDASRSQFEQERQAWLEAREQGDVRYGRQLEQFEAQLETLRRSEAELESQRDALAQERCEHERFGESLRELAAELAAKEKELARQDVAVDDVSETGIARAEALEAQQIEIDEARQELDRQREELQHEREELESEQSRARARIERQRAELEEFRNELEEARAEIQSSRDGGQQRQLAPSIVEDGESEQTNGEESVLVSDVEDVEI
jgi:chemotaxis protein MotB